MKSMYATKGLTWIDLECPTQDEVREVLRDHDIDPLVGEELLAPTVRPKVDLYPGYIYLIMHFPNLSRLERRENKEIDIIIGKDYLITSHYDQVEYLDEFRKTLEVDSILGRGAMGDHAGFLFFHLMRGLYRSLSYDLEYLHNILAEIERRVYDEESRALVLEISKVNRALLAFKEGTDIHKEILSSFEGASLKFFGPDFEFHTRSIMGEYYKIAAMVGSIKEYLKEIRETNDSLLNTKQNEIMKTLTIMSFFILPVSFIAAFFAMDTHLPFVGRPDDLYVVVGIMAAITIFTFVIFKRKRWM